MPSLPELSRTRVIVTLAVSACLGVVLGGVGNLALSSFFTLPEEAAELEFSDVAAATPVSGDAERVAKTIEDTERSVGGSSRGGLANDRRLFVDGIVRRNIFDSAATFAESTPDAATQDCKDSKVTLMATVVAALPEYSSALISEGGKGRALGYKVGDSVGGEGRILSIEQKKVCLDQGGCLCMGSEAKRSSAAEGEAGATSDEGGVTKLSDTKFQVDKSFLDKQLGNIETLATQVRAAPKTEDGKVVGFRLSAIRKGSVFDKLGIKNGDVVHAVNGTPLTSMEGAMAAFSTLQNERSFAFETTRRNNKMTLEYEVR